jgi:hypothetical protein
MSAIKLPPSKPQTILSNRASSEQSSASAESAGWLFSPSTSAGEREAGGEVWRLRRASARPASRCRRLRRARPAARPAAESRRLRRASARSAARPVAGVGACAGRADSGKVACLVRHARSDCDL